MGAGRPAAEYTQATGRKGSDVMIPDVRTVNENTPIEEIVRLMERHQIKRVLVVRDRKLVGIARATLAGLGTP
jgi:CBS domain-containing protein